MKIHPEKLRLFFLFVSLSLAPEIARAQEAARQSLEQADRELGKAWQEKYLDGLFSFYADDGVLLWTGHPVMTQNAIREFWRLRWNDPNFAITSGKRDVFLLSEAGDFAYMRGTSGFRTSAMNGSALVQEGNWLTIWQRKNGSWKILSDAFNVSAEHPAPETKN